MNNTLNQKVYDCYLKAMTEEEASNELRQPYKVIKKYYTNFTVHSAKMKANSNQDRIFQVREIERELWELYAITKKNDSHWKSINELEFTYVKFNALN